jgi:hypothetical protein
MDCSFSDASFSSGSCASEDEQDSGASSDDSQGEDAVPMQCDAPALSWQWSDVKHIPGAPTPEVAPLKLYSSSSSSSSSQQLHIQPSVAQQLRAMQAPVTAAHLSYLLIYLHTVELVLVTN